MALLAAFAFSMTSSAQEVIKNVKKTNQKETKVVAKSKSVGTKKITKTDVVLKKDGTPDKRYKTKIILKKDGTPDKRYKVNK